MLRRLGSLAAFGLSCLMTLAVMECFFHWKHDGAFSHLNLYEEDYELGVRLRPGETQRLSFAGNPTTTVRVNDWGYRGEGWPPLLDDAPPEVLVVGDSQVFGLGVEADETFSARLEERLGRPVLNAGVPTYGPGEYATAARRLLADRPVDTVVVVINLYNDLFEASRPNSRRHVVWDGWAVRSETAPADFWRFPGRRALLRSSHLLFAARRAWYLSDAPNTSVAAESEGSWSDVVVMADATREQTATLDAERREQRAALERAMADAERTIEELALTDRDSPLHLRSPSDEMAWEAAVKSPGDIVYDRYAEASRPIEVTAEMIRLGAELREQTLAAAREMSGREGAVAAQLDEASEELEALAKPAVVSPVAPHLHAMAADCRAAGARLVVVALPMDVQVSQSEWAKYALSPQDMSSTLGLNQDILTAAGDAGASGLDALPALAGAEPGAFLHGDLHMTAKGHQALADALYAHLTE